MIKEKGKFQALGTRLAVAAIWIAVCLIVFFKLPFWATAILETIASFLMAYELSYNTGLVKDKVICAECILQAVTIPWLIYFEVNLYIFISFMFAFVFALFFTEIISKNKAGTQGIFAALFSAYIFPVFISLLAPIIKLENGRFLVLIPFISAWCADAGAYFIGSAFGKHKLAPTISPKKSIEGMIGGMAGGVAGMLIYDIILSFAGKAVSWLIFTIIGFMGAVFGLLGDLFLSYIKRECQIKDFGNFLPGHGGVLDRFDSALFVIPVCFMIFKFI